MFALPIIIIVLLTAIDQLSKWLVLSRIKSTGDVEVIKNFFYLTYVENRGAAFGFMHGARWIFIIATIVIIVMGAIYYVRLNKNSYTGLIRGSLIVICAGALGNFIDRLFRGYVVDMLHFIFWGHSFAVFNFADMLVVCGTIVLAGAILFSSTEEMAEKGKNIEGE